MYVRKWNDLAASTWFQGDCTSGALSVQAAWLHLERYFLGVVTIPGVAKCTFGRRGYCRVFSVTRRHAENVINARAVLSSNGVFTSARTSDDRRALLRVSAHNTEQIAGRK